MVHHEHATDEDCDIECIRQMEREAEDQQATGCCPQPTWYHMDGSICPDWNQCDTYLHTQQVPHPLSAPEESEQRDGNVGELVDGRVDVYGDPVMCFTRHAQVWSGILGIEVLPWQVALCMLGYKLVRTSITPDYSDNSDDIDGYKDIFVTLMGDEMVQARDTAGYLAGGGQGARS